MKLLKIIRKKLQKQPLNVPNDNLETVHEYIQRWRSIRIMYFTLFLMSVGFSIILTGVWPYLDKLDPTAGKEFLGYIVTANPFGQMMFSTLCGFWGNKIKSVRMPMYLTLAIFIIGNAIYAMLDIFPVHVVKYIMVASRFLTGVAAEATLVTERTGAVSMGSLAQIGGFIIGPALQAIFSALGDKGFTFVPDIITINMFTAAGWINVLLAIGNFVLILPIFFTVKLIITSLTMDQFAWDREEAVYYIGITVTIGGIISCGMFVIIPWLCRYFTEFYVLLIGGYLTFAIARFLWLPFGSEFPKMAIRDTLYLESNQTNDELLGCPVAQAWCLTTPMLKLSQFLIGYGIAAVAYPIGMTLIQTLLSKQLGARPQGVWIGIMIGAGCLARITGPVFITYVYTIYGIYFTFGISGGANLMITLWSWVIRRKFLPVADGGTVVDEVSPHKDEINTGVEDTRL